MKKILLILLLSLPIILSCTKDNRTADEQYDRVNDYAVFVSATNKVVTGNKAEVQLNIQLKNLNQIYHAHIYAYQNIYQYTLQWQEPQQYVIDKFIEPTTTSRQYYFVVVLRNDEVLTGKPFTANFQ